MNKQQKQYEAKQAILDIVSVYLDADDRGLVEILLFDIINAEDDE